jgi:hypothetical protein
MGFNAVHNGIVSVSVIQPIPKTILFQDFEMMEFWKHSPGKSEPQNNEPHNFEG